MHATDRLVQVHLVLAAARGELLSLFGERKFARTVDRAVRALGLVNGLDGYVAKLRPDTRRWLETYCDGFNAGAARRGTPSLLRLLGRPVELYTPKSVFTVYRLVAFFGLTSMQQTAEMIITELVANGAPQAVFDALLGDAAEGLDLAKLSELRMPPEYALLSGSPLGGSNAFAISGRVSASGNALLMGEFHMEVGRFPPVVYASHVAYADGTFYQGLGIPGFAWNSSGRNDTCAFSCTFGHGDNVDIIADRCKDEKHLVNGEWKPLVRRVERVRVRGRRDAESWVFYDNEYGTILGDASIEGTYPCIRWSGHGDIAGDADAAFDGLSVTNVEQGIETFKRFNVVSLQNVLADSTGAVGDVHSGRVDVRPDGWTGAYPRAGWDLADRSPAADHAGRPEPGRGADRVVAANHRPPQRARQAVVHDARAERALRSHHGAARRACAISTAWCASRTTSSIAARRACSSCGRRYLPDDAESRALVKWGPEQRDRAQLGLFHALHGEVTRALLERSIGTQRAGRIMDELGAALLFQYHLDRVLALERLELLDAAQLRDLLARAWSRAKGGTARKGLPVERRFFDLVTQGKLGSALGLCSAAVEFPGAPCAPFQTRTVRFEDESLVFGPAFHYVTDLGERGGWYHVPGWRLRAPHWARLRQGRAALGRGPVPAAGSRSREGASSLVTS